MMHTTTGVKKGEYQFLRIMDSSGDMVNVLSSREGRIDLLEKELKNYVPDHWLFAEDDSEDNAAEAEDEPEPEQQEFDFGEVVKRRPN